MGTKFVLYTEQIGTGTLRPLHIGVENESATNQLVLATDGTVGIGTASPGCTLHLNQASSEQLRLDSTSATGSPYISFYQSGTRRSYIQHLDTNDELKFRSEYGKIGLHTGSTEQVSINNDGKVLLHSLPTSDPAVSGALYINGDVIQISHG